MRTSDAISLAAAHGWSDDTAWSRSAVEAQMSVERDGFLGGVQVLVTGKVTWTVAHLAGSQRSQRGTAPTVEAALRACDEAITAQTGVLF